MITTTHVAISTPLRVTALPNPVSRGVIVTASDPRLTDVVEALDEIMARETQLTSEINRLANVYGYESVSLHARINYRAATFPSLVDLVQKVVTHALQTEATIDRVEKAIAEGPLHRLDFPTSKDPYGIERQTIRVALDGGGDGCVAERG